MIVFGDTASENITCAARGGTLVGDVATGACVFPEATVLSTPLLAAPTSNAPPWLLYAGIIAVAVFATRR